ncbi:MAG: HNH endonuclease [Sphingomonadales bacterium]|nr:MAG: HNH endonuclease [Sphingomonadales bacterium]
MRLNINFLDLDAVAARFRSQATIKVSLDSATQWDPVDVDLRKGREVELDDVEVIDGLLSVEGRQVLLYIRDHSFGFSEALLDPMKGRKFHVAECETLEMMRSRNRFERYVATNRMDGLFNIAGTDRDGMARDADVRLHVCINCLKRLNYGSVLVGNQAFRHGVRDRFSLHEFFETYSTLFKNLPSGFAKESGSVGYSDDWTALSSSIRKHCGYRCDECRVVLLTEQRLLQVHHKNGVKTDNRRENLRPLCMDCHRKEPDHGHIFIPAADMRLIAKLRTDQNVVANEWDTILKRADLAIRPGLELAFKKGWPPPELAATLRGDNGRDQMVDASWHQRKCAVTSGAVPRILGWHIYSPIQLVDELADR